MVITDLCKGVGGVISKSLGLPFRFPVSNSRKEEEQ